MMSFVKHYSMRLKARVKTNMQFNVGDKVRVRKDLIVGKMYGGLEFIENMQRDDVCEIFFVDTDEDICMIEPYGYFYSAEMLEPVPEDGKPTNREIERLDNEKNKG